MNAGCRERVFHYTVGAYLPEIIESGTLKPATANVPEDEFPAVWCTTSADWEQTANKAVVDEAGDYRALNQAETNEVCGLLLRIEVRPEAAPLDWHQFRELSGVDPRVARMLKEIAAEQNSDVADWRLSFEPIPSERWLSIEGLDNDGKWVRVAGEGGLPDA